LGNLSFVSEQAVERAGATLAGRTLSHQFKYVDEKNPFCLANVGKWHPTRWLHVDHT
jgi:hypothetical protein